MTVVVGSTSSIVKQGAAELVALVAALSILAIVGSFLLVNAAHIGTRNSMCRRKVGALGLAEFEEGVIERE